MLVFQNIAGQAEGVPRVRVERGDRSPEIGFGACFLEHAAMRVLSMHCKLGCLANTAAFVVGPKAHAA